MGDRASAWERGEREHKERRKDTERSIDRERASSWTEFVAADPFKRFKFIDIIQCLLRMEGILILKPLIAFALDRLIARVSAVLNAIGMPHWIGGRTRTNAAFSLVLRENSHCTTVVAAAAAVLLAGLAINEGVALNGNQIYERDFIVLRWRKRPANF